MVHCVLYFVVRVRCRRKESSRSLSHLLMSFFVGCGNANRNVIEINRDLTESMITMPPSSPPRHVFMDITFVSLHSHGCGNKLA